MSQAIQNTVLNIDTDYCTMHINMLDPAAFQMSLGIFASECKVTKHEVTDQMQHVIRVASFR